MLQKVVQGPHPVDVHVGRRVCDMRRSLGYNQTELARALGLTFQQVQKYEKGSNRISASKLWDTSCFLQAEIRQFFDGLEEPGSSASPENPGPHQDQAVPSRDAVEITRLAPRLTIAQQKIVMALLQEMVDAAERRAKED